MAPTFGEARRVVVDVAQADVDGGGAGQAAQLAAHVLGLDQNLVLLLHLPVHIGQSRFYDAWRAAAGSMTRTRGAWGKNKQGERGRRVRRTVRQEKPAANSGLLGERCSNRGQRTNWNHLTFNGEDWCGGV